MPLQRIFIARGGEHTANGREIADEDTSITGLPRDPGLSPNGSKQAGELAMKMQQESQRGLLIHSSPAFRCLETAAPVAEAFSTPIVAEAGLASWYITAVEHPSRAAAAHLPRLFPRCHVDVHSSLVTPPIEGESVNALHRRAEKLMKRLIPRLEHKAGASKIDLLLCTHAPCAIALTRILTGQDALHLALGFGSLTVLERTSPDSKYPLAGWTLRKTGETSYLSGGLQNPWTLKARNDPPSPNTPEPSESV